MKIKQLVNGMVFHVDEDGSLVVEVEGEVIEVPHLVALELIEYLRLKLYQHQETNDSFLKRLFR